MNNIHPRVKHHLEFLIMITIFLVFFGIGMYLLSGYAVHTARPARAASTRSTIPTIYMDEQYENSEVHVNEVVPYEILADTKGKPITDYQVLLELHPSLQVTNISSKVDGMLVTSEVKEGYVIIKGSSTKPVIVSNEPLFEVKLQPVTTGLLMFDINDQRENNRTAFSNKGIDLPITLDAEGSLSVK